jgi:uncharacterized protein (TIGR00725 family)
MRDRKRKLTIGVMGSAGGDMSSTQTETARTLGRAIAERDCVIITGACPGFPFDAHQGAKEAGGLSVGVSPGLSLTEHVHRYQSPHEGFDVMVFTGSGLMGREIANIRSCDIVVIVGGRSGTLGEFSIAYDEGKLIGVLEGSGGIADALPEIVRVINKETGAHVIYDDEPKKLVDRLIDYYWKKHYKMASVFEAVLPAGVG